MLRVLALVLGIVADGGAQCPPGEQDRDEHQHVAELVRDFDALWCVAAFVFDRESMGQAVGVERAAEIDIAPALAAILA